MKYLKIYLAGKMWGLTYDEMNSWRVAIKEKLMNAAKDKGYTITVINPVDFYNFEEVRYKSDEEVEDYDLAHVLSSNIVVLNVNGLTTSDGTKIEIHDANFHNKIPVLAFDEKGLYEDVHPWNKRDITRVDIDMDNLVRYIKDFYMI